MRLYDIRCADRGHQLEVLVDQGEKLLRPACASSRVTHQPAAFSIGVAEAIRERLRAAPAMAAAALAAGVLGMRVASSRMGNRRTWTMLRMVLSILVGAVLVILPSPRRLQNRRMPHYRQPVRLNPRIGAVIGLSMSGRSW